MTMPDDRLRQARERAGFPSAKSDAEAMGVPMRWAFVTGMVGVASLRLAALYFGWQLPALQMLQMHP